ncbi:MAG: collagen-like protein, partial [Saccharospirillaceae bacterium]|nr:collagen-like protein [Saccharospirillaceae bacterium]
MKIILPLLLVTPVLLPVLSLADTPNTVALNGYLFDKFTEQSLDGEYQVRFTLYDPEAITSEYVIKGGEFVDQSNQGHTVIWTVLKDVVFVEGAYSVKLGEINPFPKDAFLNANQTIGIQIGNDVEFEPRLSLSAVPFAKTADNVVGDITPKSISISDFNGFSTTVINEYGQWVGDAYGLIGPQGLHGSTGDQGEVGPQGEAGLLGEKGEVGIQGEIGLTGLQGEKGEVGDQGIQGLVGVAGPEGDHGLVGSQGIIGLTGSQGETGETGVQGVTGLTGQQGEDGIQGVIGDQGVIGLTGPQGNVGPQGSIGNQGVEGTQGLSGDQGQKGEVGEQGEIGLTGSQGVVGEAGSQGEAGLQGVTGNQGEVGPKGLTGDQGLQG